MLLSACATTDTKWLQEADGNQLEVATGRKKMPVLSRLITLYGRGMALILAVKKKLKTEKSCSHN